MEQALLVTIRVRTEKGSWQLEDSAEELEELVATTGAAIVDNMACIVARITPNIFIGKGKAAEIAERCNQEHIDTVIFSEDLSGTQQRNLEEIIGKKTIDRTQLILDIFARHAKSPEGKMQVELAQLQYLFPRLVGKGVLLSRLGGGIGTRGPGEQKLEIDRRRIRQRINRLKEDLQQVSLRRANMRKQRKENQVPTVALVGYTNAGKSTLLNALTDAGQEVLDSLFTTLDPLHKSFSLPNGERVIIADTVGFLHRLPHHLVEAFKATLEEVAEADLLIHVLDAAHRRLYAHQQAVSKVLAELGVGDKPLITALNKIDLLADAAEAQGLARDFVNPVAISAKLKINLDQLCAKIEAHFAGRMIEVELKIPHSRMDVVNRLYQEGKVRDARYLQDGVYIKVYMSKSLYYSISKISGIEVVN